MTTAFSLLRTIRLTDTDFSDLTGVKRQKVIMGVSVYIAKSIAYTGESVYPPARNEEIASATSDKVRRDKFSSWKLLSYALKDFFGKAPDSFVFSKTENGKWIADYGYFSLSHSGDVACVAVSSCQIGVDIEDLNVFDRKICNKKERFIKKICSAREAEELKNAPISRLAAVWTQKESNYKLSGKGVFVPCKIAADDKITKTCTVEFFGVPYVVSVAGEGGFDGNFIIVPAAAL